MVADDPAGYGPFFPGPAFVDCRSGSSAPSLSAPLSVPTLVDLRVLELLTARLCHELSGPIAAINNGVELLADEPVLASGRADPNFMRDAVALVGDSARKRRQPAAILPLRLWFRSWPPMAGRRQTNWRPIFSRGHGSTAIVPTASGFCRSAGRNWPAICCRSAPSALPRGGGLVLTVGPAGLMSKRSASSQLCYRRRARADAGDAGRRAYRPHGSALFRRPACQGPDARLIAYGQTPAGFG